MRGHVTRLAALTGLAVLAAAAPAQFGELRGQVAFARFRRAVRMADAAREAGAPVERARAVRTGSAEADLVTVFAPGDASALSRISEVCTGWAAEPELDPLLRLRLGEKAVVAAGLAARAAPSDYEPWLRLARALGALGLWEQAEGCLTQARRLAPPGSTLEVYPVGVTQAGRPLEP